MRDGWRKPGAILDLQLIKNPSLRLAMLIYLCVPGVFTGTHMIAVLYLHNLGVGAAQTGALMLPWAVGSGVAIMLGKRSFNRIGPKPLLSVGMLLQCLGIVLLMRIEQPASTPLIIAYALMGLGGSLCSVTAQTLAFVGISQKKWATPAPCGTSIANSVSASRRRCSVHCWARWVVTVSVPALSPPRC